MSLASRTGLPDTSSPGPSGRAGSTAHRAAHSEWAVRLGRAGLVAKGVLYLTVALLAFKIAVGERDDAADKQGALHQIKEQPFGAWLLGLLAIGLACYAVWCVLRTLLVDEDSEAKAWVERAGHLGRAALYGSACIAAISIVRAQAKPAAGAKEQTWTATVMGWPGGRLLVAAVGLALIATAAWNGYRAVTRKFEEKLDRSAMSETQWRTVGWIAIAGLFGRVLAFTAVGWFLVKAAIDFRADEPIGLDESLRSLQARSYGPWVIMLTAVGLALYGIYTFAEARWRRLPD